VAHPLREVGFVDDSEYGHAESFEIGLRNGKGVRLARLAGHPSAKAGVRRRDDER
jgi:hypothetical protein